MVKIAGQFCVHIAVLIQTYILKTELIQFLFQNPCKVKLFFC